MTRLTLQLLVVAALAIASVSADHIQYQLRNRSIKVRGVNLGSWLVGEHWMSYRSPMWGDLPETVTRGGEWQVMKELGHEKGDELFDQHRRTWITRDDIKQIADLKLNTVRVPVGYWIVNGDPTQSQSELSKVFAPGGSNYDKSSLRYLDDLVRRWAKELNVAVMLSLHAHQGSQNGYDHSAPTFSGEKNWPKSQENFDNSVHFATFLASRYKNEPAFLGLNLMNEPSFGEDTAAMDRVKEYYRVAYNRIRGDGNDCVIVLSPGLNQQTPEFHQDLMVAPAYRNVWHEFHRYYIWGFENQTEQFVIDSAKAYADGFLVPNVWHGNPLLMGEWCLAGPASAPFSNAAQLKQLADAQLESYEAAGAGWTFWSWRHDDEFHPKITTSGWSMRQLISQGHLKLPWLQ